MSNRKFLKVEKVLIADVDVSKYTTYDCKELIKYWRCVGIEVRQLNNPQKLIRIATAQV